MIALLFILLIPFAAAGLALIHQGLGRSRSSAHTLLATLCAIAIAAVVFLAVGCSWAGHAGGAAHVLHGFDWLGAEPFMGQGLYAKPGSARETLVLCFQLFAVGLAAMIPISTGSDRWRMTAIGAWSVVAAGLIYPLLSHWIWGGGWLATRLPELGLPGFVDAGGAGAIQVLGGLGALSVGWVLGPRRGKYTQGMATAIPGHNIVLVHFGCLLALVGWFGLEGAASLLFYNIAPERLVWVAINCLLGASSALLFAVVATRLRYRKTDSSISANGWVAGLVAVSAGGAWFSPGQAIFVGLMAGGLVTFLVEIFELWLMVDDPGGAISVHGAAGLWGLVAFGLLAPPAGSHLLAQLVGVATLLGLGLPLVHGLNMLIDRFVPYRVDMDGDWQGMDIRELGSGAYPEFVIHTDEFVPR
ncbi:ammonium transporter [Granulicella rosea]|uniref:Ammonium transporter n=1 Tax=Granulicella rosea TaxID=474952 RepID=A0A239EDY7_9BACT|nr:hypothetical protein [Granulicella rosea]SNS42885.1 ammonium transporter [Granulicella rosea]